MASMVGLQTVSQSQVTTAAILSKAATTSSPKAAKTGATLAPQKEVRALTMNEVKALRVALAADRAAASVDLPLLVDMLLATGARIGEALALRWDDVDLDAGTVAITGTVVRVKCQGMTRQDTTKGKKVRRLQLPPFAVAQLLERSVTGPHGGEWNLVFPSAVSGLREVTTVERQWRVFREAPGLEVGVPAHVPQDGGHTHRARARPG